LAKTVHYIPSLEEMHIIDEDGDVYESFVMSLDKKYYKDLKCEVIEVSSSYNEDTDEYDDVEHDSYVIPRIYLLTLYDKRIIRHNRWDRERMFRRLGVEILESKCNDI